MDGGRSVSAWDGSSPPKRIQQVWDYLTQELRTIRDKIRMSTDDFYGKFDRMSHLHVVSEALRVARETSLRHESVGSTSCLHSLIDANSKSSLSPRTVVKAQEVLRKYEKKMSVTISKLTDSKEVFEREVLDVLEMYCSNYMKLGVQDDKFFKTLRSRTLRIRDHLRDFDKLSRHFNEGSIISPDCFCHDEFSQTVAIEFDCDKFPVLRIVPDLIQKFELVCTLAQDWLRSDKVYLEEVRRQIQKTKDRIKGTSGDCHATKLDYERLFALLKQKQYELEDHDESFECICKEVAQMECKKTRMQIEIHAVIRSLKSCRENIRDLRAISITRQQSSEQDEVDGVAPEYDSDEEAEEEEKRMNAGMGHAHASYRTRLCRDARSHNVKLDFLKKKLKKLAKKIDARKTELKDLKEHESDIQSISRELRGISRRKSKLLEDISSMNGHLEGLEQLLTHRLNPTGSGNRKRSNGRPKRSHRPRSGSRYRSKNKSKPSSRGDSRGSSASSRNSARLASGHKNKKNNGSKKLLKRRSREMDIAFRLVKNNIGHQWRDLARCLASRDASRELDETNADIRAIEYEHQGQLKEQAYQSLLKWYNNCGRRASIEVLNRSLREIKENRLAESIEREVLDTGLSETDICRSA